MRLINILAPRIHCVFCGKEVRPDQDCACPDCAVPPGFFAFAGEVAGAAPFAYSQEISVIIKKLKYKNSRYIAQFLGGAMTACAKELNLSESCVVIPVPLHKKRRRERGFNQSEHLAKEVARRLNLPCRPGFLKRVKHTRQQTDLTSAQRKENVSGAFAAVPGCCAAALLVDDVFTTGSTIAAAAEALKKAGCRQVFAVTAAKTQSASLRRNL